MSEENSKNKRFEKLYKDPKFKPIPKKVHKVELNDDRFNAMFKDKNFISATDIDEYGRKIKNGKKNIEMENYYLKKDKHDKHKEKKKEEKAEEEVEEEAEEEEAEDNIDENIEEEAEENIDENIENNEGDEESDTSEEFAEYLNNQGDMENESEPEENIPTGDESSRLAIMNIDWENIHAIDWFVLLNSFCSGKSKVLKVEIFPSEFGINELKKEREHGPDKEIFAEQSTDPGENNSKRYMKKHVEDDVSAGFNQVELRKYELKKLKYYYAVVTCDSIKTASHWYNEWDNQEIERLQSFMDMRFIPDSLKEFPYPPKEVCDHIPHDFDYVPNFRPNAALQDTKVKLTWEQNDPKRDDLISRAFHKEQFNDEDMKEWLVSSESEDEDWINEINKSDDDEGKNDLMLLGKKRKERKFKDGETIEIKFKHGFEGINDKVKDGKDKEDKSKWQQFKEEKKNIRKEKKLEEKKHRSEVNMKRKGETSNKKELNLLVDNTIKNTSFKYNEKDSRFNIKNNVDFAVDPTNKDYNKHRKQKKNK